MEKHTKEYAFSVACKTFTEETLPSNSILRVGAIVGYMKAIQETNVSELLAQLKSNHEMLLRCYQYLGSKDNVLAEAMRTEMFKINELIKKATE